MFDLPIQARSLLALDGKDYELGPDDLVIADHERVLAIAGVMGGEGSGVAATTTDLLLEAAYFNPGSIRRTSRRLGLISDSSFRFERGVDPEAVLLASARAIDLLIGSCRRKGGRKHRGWWFHAELDRCSRDAS